MGADRFPPFRKINKNFWIFLNKIRFFSPWNFFEDISSEYFDIRIVAVSKNNTYNWSLRNDKIIGGININTNLARLTMCFYYKIWFKDYFNEYFLNKTLIFLREKSEELKLFQIKLIWFESLNDSIGRSELIFSKTF